MGNIFSNPLIVTLASAIVLAMLGGFGSLIVQTWRHHQLFSLYQNALSQVGDANHFALTPTEARLLADSLRDPQVRGDITTISFGPIEEKDRIGEYVTSHAPPDSRFRDSMVTEQAIIEWLLMEFAIEGQYPAFHARVESRRSQINAIRLEKQKKQNELDAPQPQNSKPDSGDKTGERLSTFFKPLANIQGIAKNCLGRQDLLHELRTDFDRPQQCLIAIEGFGGIGKTTLGSRLAADISQQYDVLWVSCHEQFITVDKVLRELALFASQYYSYHWLNEIVENDNLSLDEKISGLIEFLAYNQANSSGTSIERPNLATALFFDDFHDVQDRNLDHLISRIANSQLNTKVVLLLRNRHQLTAELQGLLNISDPINLDGLSLTDCDEVLRFYAKHISALDHLDTETVERVWQRTGQGVPQALIILISRARTRPLKALLNELPDYRLEATATNDLWFDGLFSELTPPEQQALMSIAILRRHAPLALLLHLCHGGNADQTIEALIDRFILNFDGKLYWLHALWSDYARRKLTPDEARTEHLQVAIFMRDDATMDRYTHVMNQLESCYHFLQAEKVEDAIPVLVLISNTLQSWGYFQELLAMIDEIERRLSERGESLDPILQMERCIVLARLGEIESSIALLEALITNTTGRTQIRAMQYLGWILSDASKRVAAMELFQRSLELARDLQQPDLQGGALHGMHNFAYLNGQYAEALEWSQQRIDLWQALGDDQEALEAIAGARRDIGNVLREQGKFAEALDLYQEALKTLHERGDPPTHIGWLKYDIGQILYQLDRWEKAQASYEEALQIFEAAKYMSGIAHTRIELGRNGCHIVFGKDEAVAIVLEAIEELRRLKNLGGMAYGYHALGEIYLYFREPERALDNFEQSLTLEELLLSIKGPARCLHGKALAHEQQANHASEQSRRDEACILAAQALGEIRQAQEIFATIGIIPEYRHIDIDADRIADMVAHCQEE